MNAGRDDLHQQVRELLSARLDGPLPGSTERELERHLASCIQCRVVQRDYTEQRRLLRALPPVPPPRDLWARTSAALDREIARDLPAGSPDEASRLPRTALVGSAAALGVALVLVSAQIGLAPGPPAAESPRVGGLPTPFGISPQRIAFVGTDASGFLLYRPRFDQVCPTSALTCLEETDLSPQLVRLPPNARPGNLTLSPDGERMAITAHESGREGIFALLLSDPDPVRPPTDQPPASPLPDDPLPISTPGEASPVASPSPAAIPTLEPSAPQAAVLETVPIMQDVRTAGAPASWSPSGELLAFSAMPADATRGPDLYVWRAGEETAQPLTSDHGTYFASWSGEHIVASRLVQPDADEEIEVEPSLVTLVIDPQTGEERAVDAGELWLPVVSPLGDYAVTWSGLFEVDASGVKPLEGALYLTDWAALDPYAPADDADQTGQPRAPEEPAVEPAPGEESPSIEPESAPASPSAEPRVSPLPNGEEALPSPTEATEEDDPSEREGEVEAVDEVDPVEPPTSALLALEPARDPHEHPVLEWLARWSSDGSAIGYWVADAPNASWGQLRVVALGHVLEDLEGPQELLGPTLARRSFSLGPDRIAWIGPSETDLHGELRVRTWGSLGEGGLRWPSFDLREVVLAF